MVETSLEDPDENPVMIATQQEMAEARLPLSHRDYCAHLLIPLNSCRYKNNFFPWKCEEEKHAYEKCQYEDEKSDFLLFFKQYQDF
ncbi:3291_t:CDS:2 [Diversispora eburnea]|uniref:NADH dehydrogenase [ubiquinone] 1 beta subcomplex subunit 7 n=1 Tax=Diversispora eburnea TaxID=1213867 RepID=A0A9N9F7V2_9GLOM|nr:3291_t:CDS:2 [Diversispora eburnea]